jgi:hypothetical protein
MACHVCFRTDVKKRQFSGKQHYPHKCPHGVWCVTGDRLLGHHANNTPIAGPNRCERCRDEAKRRIQTRHACVDDKGQVNWNCPHREPDSQEVRR